MATSAKSKKSAPAAPLEVDARPIVLGIIPKGELREVALDLIVEPKGQPDRVARPDDDAKIAELARSLREVGQLQPIMVEELVDGRLCRVFGRRRLAAARLNQDKTILARVIPPLADDVRRTIVAIENMQRQDLTPAEEHLAVGELLELVALEAAVQYGKEIGAGIIIDPRLATEYRKGPKTDLAEIVAAVLRSPGARSLAVDIVAAMLAKSRQWVLDRLYVSRLGPKAQLLIRDGKLPLPHAREISKVADPAMRESLAEDYAAGGEESRSNVEAGDLEDLRDKVSQNLFSLKQVGWRLDVPFADKPACDGCPHNSLSNPGLFDGTDLGVSSQVRQGQGMGFYGDEKRAEKLHEKGVCTLHSCFIHKTAAVKGPVATAAKTIADGGKPQLKPWINPDAVSAKVKERKERAGSRPKSTSSAKKADPTKEEAKRKHEEAKEQWAQKFMAEVGKTIEANPIACAYLAMHRLVSNGYQLKVEAVQAAMKANRHTLLSMVDAIVEKKHAPHDMPTYSRYYGDDLSRCLKFASACGVKVPPEPKLEEFLPKKEPAAKAEKKAPAKKPAKKAKKGA